MRHRFPIAVVLDAFTGGALYRFWLGAMMVGMLAGGAAYVIQLVEGLVVTNMTDAVSWGIYIASFTFMVGVASDGIVMVVIPAYAYRMDSFRKVVFVGEILALCAVVTCLLFVVVDIGRPDRAWHMIPGWGSLNFPVSLLSWDVVVLTGYLIINIALVFFALRNRYLGRPPPRAYVMLIFVSMAWAVFAHTVTAYLYTWLGARPYWNAAVVAPRFLASAFVSGPAFLILALRILDRQGGFPVDGQVFNVLRRIMTVSLLVNLFLFVSEVFTELYSGSHHAAGLRYLLFGHGEHTALRGWIWLALTLDVTAALILLSRYTPRFGVLELACIFAFSGVWIEKGMALVIPGFVPTPLGEVIEYTPSWVELLVSLGIMSFGAAMFTVLVRIGSRIESGALRAPVERR